MEINYSFVIPHKNCPDLLIRCLDSRLALSWNMLVIYSSCTPIILNLIEI